MSVERGDPQPSNRFHIVEKFQTALTAADHQNTAELAASMIKDEPALGSSWSFGDLVARGDSDRSSLLIGDQHEIGLFAQASPSPLDYRMATLSRDGDMVVVNKRNLDFEAYLGDRLQLNETRFVQASEAVSLEPIPIAKRCIEEPELHDTIKRLALNAGRLNLFHT